MTRRKCCLIVLAAINNLNIFTEWNLCFNTYSKTLFDLLPYSYFIFIHIVFHRYLFLYAKNIKKCVNWIGKQYKTVIYNQSHLVILTRRKMLFLIKEYYRWITVLFYDPISNEAVRYIIGKINNTFSPVTENLIFGFSFPRNQEFIW